MQWDTELGILSSMSKLRNTLVHGFTGKLAVAKLTKNIFLLLKSYSPPLFSHHRNIRIFWASGIHSRLLTPYLSKIHFNITICSVLRYILCRCLSHDLRTCIYCHQFPYKPNFSVIKKRVTGRFILETEQTGMHARTHMHTHNTTQETQPIVTGKRKIEEISDTGNLVVYRKFLGSGFHHTKGESKWSREVHSDG